MRMRTGVGEGGPTTQPRCPRRPGARHQVDGPLSEDSGSDRDTTHHRKTQRDLLHLDLVAAVGENTKGWALLHASKPEHKLSGSQAGAAGQIACAHTKTIGIICMKPET